MKSIDDKGKSIMRNTPFHAIQITGPANRDFLSIISDCIESIFNRIAILNDSEEAIYTIQLAIHETCTNIVEHAYRADENGDIFLRFSINEAPLQLVVDVEDRGQSFNPDNVQEPDSENLQVRGYGLYLIQKLMDHAIYTSSERGNKWRLTKNLDNWKNAA